MTGPRPAAPAAGREPTRLPAASSLGTGSRRSSPNPCTAGPAGLEPRGSLRAARGQRRKVERMREVDEGELCESRDGCGPRTARGRVLGQLLVWSGSCCGQAAKTSRPASRVSSRTPARPHPPPALHRRRWLSSARRAGHRRSRWRARRLPVDPPPALLRVRRARSRGVDGSTRRRGSGYDCGYRCQVNLTVRQR